MAISLDTHNPKCQQVLVPIVHTGQQVGEILDADIWKRTKGEESDSIKCVSFCA